MYKPAPADTRAAKAIRCLLLACLLSPLMAACATTAHRAIAHEHATPTAYQAK